MLGSLNKSRKQDIEADESFMNNQFNSFCNPSNTIGSINKKIDFTEIYKRNISKKNEIISQLVISYMN